MSNVMIGLAGRVGDMKLFLHLHSFANTCYLRWVRSVVINTWHTVLDKFREKEKLEEKMCCMDTSLLLWELDLLGSYPL